MFQAPNSTENAIFNDFCSLKINNLNRIPHDSTNLKIYVVFELKHLKYLNWLGLLSVTFDWMLEIWQKNCPKS